MHPRELSLKAICMALLLAGGTASAASDEARELEELRLTVVNLLQGLVDRGVLTREQATQMVQDAQGTAAADAAAATTQEQAERGAVRVPYVPEIVKEEIRTQVKQELRSEVAAEVAQTAKTEGWGVPAALPEWVRRMRWYGDLRVRGEGNYFADDNFSNAYLDFQEINAAGGIERAGAAAFVNTSEDRERMRARLRLGFEAGLGGGWTMGARIATGGLGDPVSTNQTLGGSGFRYEVGLDLAYLDFLAGGDRQRHALRLTSGRLSNPFFSPSDLVYDRDLNFDGLAASYSFGLSAAEPAVTFVRATAAAFPLQEIELSARDKWLIGGQLELGWRFTDNTSLRVGAAHYNFRNIAGQRNLFESNLLDHTAPLYLRRGNTVFDIRNDNINSTNLYALAADYELVNYSLALDARLGAGHSLTLAADYVQNIGYRESEVLARRGQLVPRRNAGYQAELGFGSAAVDKANAWRAVVGYRYVQRDAVLDAFTDSDFHLGGTDARGYYLSLDYGFTPAVTGRLKYLSADEIDGPPLGIDVVQFDLTARF